MEKLAGVDIVNLSFMVELVYLAAKKMALVLSALFALRDLQVKWV